MKQIVGSVLKERQSLLGYKDCQLAKKIGVTPQAIRSWKAEKASPRDDVKNKLLSILRLAEDQLFKNARITRSRADRPTAS